MSDFDLRNIKLFDNIITIKQDFFNVAHPVGEVYVQFPQQDTPEDLYNHDGIESIWEIQHQYDGAFFRSTSTPSAVYKADNDEQYYTYENNKLIPTTVKSTFSDGPVISTSASGTPIIQDGITYKRYTISNVTRYANAYISKTNGLIKQVA